MASRLDYSQNRKLYVGTSVGTSVADGNAIITGNVGIGTDSPGAILETSKEVDGNQVGVLLTNTRQAGTADSVSLNFGLGRTADGFIFNIPAIKFLKEQQWTGTGSTVDGSLVFSTIQNETVAERMRIDSSGNVGIGTASPQSVGAAWTTLEVQGNSTGGGGIIYTANNGASVKSHFYSDGSGGYIGTQTNQFFAFTSNNTERMRITSAGNVSIGNTNDTYKLDVTGQGRFTHSAGVPALDIRASDTNFALMSIFGNQTGDVNWLLMSGYPIAGDFTIRQSDTVNALTLTKTTGAATFSSSVTASSLIKSGGTASQYLMADGSVSTLTNPVTGTGTTNYIPKFTSGSAIGNSNIYDNAGNIGIGVTNADYPLTVGSINVGGAGASLGIVINSVIDTAIPASSVKAIIGATNSGFGYAAGSLLIQPRTGVNAVTVFTTEGTEKMRLTHDGNVGIGVTGPTEKLHVVGSQLITGGIATSVSGEALRVSNPGGASWGHQTTPTGAIKITLPQSWTDTMMRMTVKIYEYTADESFEVELGGYNNTGSSAWFNTFAHIISSGAVDKNFTVRFGHDGTYCSIYIGELTSVWQYPQVAVTNFEAGFSSYGADKWIDGWDIGTVTSFGTITSTKTSTQVTNWARNGQDLYYGSGTGNVGIGTTSPRPVGSGYKALEIGSPSSGSSLWLSGFSDTTKGYLSMDTGGLNLTAISSHPLNLGTNNSVKMTILPGGNVGIGTTTLNAISGTNPTLTLGGTGISGGLILQKAGTDTARLYENAGNMVHQGMTGIGHHFYVNAATQAMVIDSSGNVGIGVSNPETSRLLVRGSTNDSTSQIFQAANLAGATRYAIRPDGDNKWYKSDNSLSMILTSAGNVGIGTTSPDTLLQATNTADGTNYISYEIGNSAVNASNKGGFAIYELGTKQATLEYYRDGSGKFEIASQGASNHISLATTAVGGTTPTERMRITPAGGISFGSTGTAYGTTGQVLTSAGNASPTWTTPTTGTVTGTGTPGFIPKFTASSTLGNSQIKDDGTNVGIGTVGPTKKLSVVETNTAVQDVAEFKSLSTTRAYIAIRDANTSTLDDYVRLGAVGNELTLWAGNSEAIRIDSSQNVGIGFNNPSYKLDVLSIGTVAARFYKSTDDIKILIQDNDTARYIGVKDSLVYIGASPTSTNEDNLQITNGNIGIGRRIYHNSDNDTWIGFETTDEITLSAGNTSQLVVTSNNVNITDTLSYTYPSNNSEFNGEIVTFGAFESGVTFAAGELVCLGHVAGSPTWRKANNTVAVESTGMLGIALGSTPSAGILVRGFARSTAYNGFSDGGKCYISATDGDMTTIAPTATNAYLRIVGYVTDSITGAAEIYFCPDNTYVQITA